MIKVQGRTSAAIAASLERAIAAGEWTPDLPLPTVRALAGRLEVAPATVAGAYRLLRDRGLTIGGGRRGTRVRAHVPHVTAARETGVRATHGVDLSTGEPDPELLPSLDAALRALPRAALRDPATAVLPALASFASGEFAADGIPPGPVAVTSGALDAVERLLETSLAQVSPDVLHGLPAAAASFSITRRSGWPRNRRFSAAARSAVSAAPVGLWARGASTTAAGRSVSAAWSDAGTAPLASTATGTARYPAAAIA